MKKVLILTLVLFVSLTGAAYAAVTWNGMTIVKIFSSGQEVTSVTPAVVIKGSTYVPASMLRQFGFQVTATGTNITLTQPVEKPTAPLKAPLSMDQITMLMKHTVAMIYSLDSNGKIVTQGSGFVVSSSGLVITAEHVVQQNGVYQDLKVMLDGNTYNFSKDQVFHKDAERDIAAFRLPAGLYDYLPVATTQLERRESVYALGYPKGVSKVVSGEAIDHTAERIPLSMFLDHGASGGALVNRFGEAVAVIRRGGNPDLDIGDAVELSWVKDLIK